MHAIPPPEDNINSDNPKFTISNNWLAFIALILFMTTQAKDAVVAWAEARVKQATVNESVDGAIKSVVILERDVANLRTELEKVRGDIKAESGRAYEVDQGMQRSIDQNNQAIKKLESVSQPKNETPK